MELLLAIGGPVGAVFVVWFGREVLKHLRALHSIVEKQAHNGHKGEEPTVMDYLSRLEDGQAKIVEILEEMRDMSG